MSKPFIHHVFFWLEHPEWQEDREQLIEALKELASVKSIASHYIGLPADTDREVIDRSWDVSWCLFFNSKEDQDSYQEDPEHKAFVSKCAHLWKKVVVYDAVSI